LQTTFRIVVAAAYLHYHRHFTAVARAAGETAPLLFTALFSQIGGGFFSPTPALSVLIFKYATSPFPEQNQLV